MTGIWYGGAPADDDEPEPFDSDPGLDDALWVDIDHRTLHQGPCVRASHAAPWSPGSADTACPICLPEGLPDA